MQDSVSTPIESLANCVLTKLIACDNHHIVSLEELEMSFKVTE